MCMAMTREIAGPGSTAVGNGRSAIWGHNADVEVYQPLARDGRVNATHAMGRVTGRTGDPICIDMFRVLGEGGIGKHLG